MTSDPHGNSEPEQPVTDVSSGTGARAFPAHLKARREELESQVAHARENFDKQVAHARENFDEAQERIKARTGRDLIGAILIGLALGAVVLGSLLFLKWIFVILAVVAAGAAVYELARAFQTAGRRIDLIPQLVTAVALVGSAYVAETWALWVLLFAGVSLIIVWRLIGQMSAQDGRVRREVLGDILASVLIPVYIPFLTTLALLVLREENGQNWIILFLTVVVSADTGAYAIGLWLGKHPMAPRVSPKKTWEGLGGAAVFAVVTATLVCIFLLGLPWWTGLVCGLALLLTATLGDLGESMIKRDLGIKDMSSWIPGHGGILDRLDSILPSAVAVLALHHFLSPLAVLS
ncbi:phosphatidate cytidylyltransferase [Microbacterium sp. GXS0129]|uniref:phosphatidate cytidylyltransferase n=1 Tax=Microbacterium sp. GXS0129 TaxID=3377836 RepID=UPI00383A5387